MQFALHPSDHLLLLHFHIDHVWPWPTNTAEPQSLSTGVTSPVHLENLVHAEKKFSSRTQSHQSGAERVTFTLSTPISCLRAVGTRRIPESPSISATRCSLLQSRAIFARSPVRIGSCSSSSGSPARSGLEVRLVSPATPPPLLLTRKVFEKMASAVRGGLPAWRNRAAERLAVGRLIEMRKQVVAVFVQVVLARHERHAV